jgi:hypothetical protein
MTRRIAAALLLLVVAHGVAARAGVAQGVGRTLAAADVQFTAHEIATGLRGGYQVVVTDLNKDGKPDIIALASGLPELLWFENPTWERHVLVGGVSQLINAAANDVDGDGIPEIAVAQGFTTSPKTSTGIVSILTHGADPKQPWTPREIDRVPTAHRLRWVDAEGSGRKWLVNAPLVGPDAVSPDYKSPVSIYYYRPPDYKRETLTDTFTGLIHGIEPVAWQGVRGQSVLSAGFMGIYLHHYGMGKWTPTELSKGDPAEWPKSGTSDIALGRLGTKRILATIEPWHGNQVTVYYDDKTAWRRQVIDSGIADGHAIVTFDADGDGSDEIVAAQRGGARSLVMFTASKDGATWTRRVLDEGGMAGAGCAAADLNADRRVDIVCIGTATANLKWYENTGK